MPNRDARAAAEALARADAIDLLAALVTIVLLALDFMNRVGAERLVLTLVFAFFVPGRAMVSNWPRMAGWSDVGMSIVLSLGTVTMLALIMLWARFWHPIGLFDFEAVLSLIGLGVAVARRRQVREMQQRKTSREL